MKLGRIVGELTQQQLKSVLRYDADTGVFVWSENANPGLVGKIAGFVVVGYRTIEIYGRRYGAHRLAWLYAYGAMPKAIDHANGNPDDNRISNLRLATASQNGANSRRPSHNTTGMKGVHAPFMGRYKAVVTVNGKKVDLGSFSSKQEAQAAYMSAARQHFGEFAHDGERPGVVYRKQKAGPYSHLRLTHAPDDPRIENIRPNQKNFDPRGVPERLAKTYLKAKRKQEKAQADLQRAIDGFAKKQRRKEQHRNRLTAQPKSV